jgi:hypothetical protein
MSNGIQESWPTARTGWYATLILTLAYTLSFIDRQVLNLLVEPNSRIPSRPVSAVTWNARDCWSGITGSLT